MRLNPIVTQPMFDADLHFFGPEEQIYQLQQKPQKTMNQNEPKPKLIARHRPDCTIEFLRYQFGIPAIRLQTWPIYDILGKTVIGEEHTKVPCSLFHLLGHGSTKAAAYHMARRALEKLTAATA